VLAERGDQASQDTRLEAALFIALHWQNNILDNITVL